MEYKILRVVLGRPGEIPISEDEFNAIKAARDTISLALAAEQKFDMVVENFLDFEREALDISLQHMARMYRPWRAFARERQRINRRLGNLTFANKLLTDQLRRDATVLFDRGSDESEQFNLALADEDEYLAHRAMKLVRNRIQHRDFPDLHITYRSGWEGANEDRMHSCLSVEMLVASLAEGVRPGDRKREALIEELKAVGDKIDVLEFARLDMESIARIFERFRKLVESRLTGAEQLMEETIARGRNEFGDKIVGLAAVAMEAPKRMADEIQLLSAPMEYGRSLRETNAGFTSISRRQISNMSRRQRNE